MINIKKLSLTKYSASIYISFQRLVHFTKSSVGENKQLAQRKYLLKKIDNKNIKICIKINILDN